MGGLEPPALAPPRWATLRGSGAADGEVRRLASVEAPSRGGRTGLAADAAAIAVASRAGANTGPPGEEPSGGSGSRGDSAANREPRAGAAVWTSRGTRGGSAAASGSSGGAAPACAGRAAGWGGSGSAGLAFIRGREPEMRPVRCGGATGQSTG